MSLSALANLFGVSGQSQSSQVTWARERSSVELRQFVTDRHQRLSTVDLLLDEV